MFISFACPKETNQRKGHTKRCYRLTWPIHARRFVLPTHIVNAAHLSGWGGKIIF
jgi:hypothetical protein